jgi:hypothetical protein
MTMGTAAYRRLPLFAALVVGIGFALGAATRPAPARAAQKEKDQPKDAVLTTDPVCEYLKGSEPTAATAGQISTGIAACRACHSGADQGQAKGYVEGYKSNEFVALNESTTWDEKDIHAAAMKCLTDPLGKQMEAVLKKVRPEGYTVTKAVECLACHSVDKSPKTPLAEKKYENFATLPGGVTCTVCHGLYDKWQNEHFKEPDQAGMTAIPWRDMTPAYKYSRGMRDVRNPVVKAQLCASCHVGDASEGKVVTHEIYAAGHPPLPPFELASYLEGEPKHWSYATKLKYFESVKPGDDWKRFHFHPASKEAYLARHYAVGAVVALRAEAELILAEANRVGSTGEGLDFARFDCYSCHHELRSPSERQKRGYDGPPGRTPMRAAAGIPAGVVAHHAEKSPAADLKAHAAGFDAKWLALKKAATAKPFGDPVKVKDEAKAMKEWCDAFLKVQSESPEPLYPEAEAVRLRDMVIETAVGVTSVADPEAAMALTWGARTLATETGTKIDDKKLEALAAILPPNVRTAPYSQMTGKKSLPEQAKFPERMKQVSTFTGPKFVEAFDGVFGKPK